MSHARTALVLCALFLAACGGSDGTTTVVVAAGEQPPPALFNGAYHMSIIGGSTAGGLENFLVSWGDATADPETGLLSFTGSANADGVVNASDENLPFEERSDRELALEPFLPAYDALQGGVSEDGSVAAAAAATPFIPPYLMLFTRAGSGYDNATVAGTYQFAAMSSTAVGNSTGALWGTITFDGAGGGNAEVTTNAEGAIVGPFVVPINYTVEPDGGLQLAINGALILQGGIGADGEVALLGGGVIAGDNPTQYVLVRQGAGLADADLDGIYFFAGLTQEVGSNLYGSISGHLLADGAGSAFFTGYVNNQGDVTVEPPEPLTTTVAGDGTISVTTGGGDVFHGSLSASGRFGIFAGPDGPGTNPSFFFFFR